MLTYPKSPWPPSEKGLCSGPTLISNISVRIMDGPEWEECPEGCSADVLDWFLSCSTREQGRDIQDALPVAAPTSQSQSPRHSRTLKPTDMLLGLRGEGWRNGATEQPGQTTPVGAGRRPPSRSQDQTRHWFSLLSCFLQ